MRREIYGSLDHPLQHYALAQQRHATSPRKVSAGSFICFCASCWPRRWFSCRDSALAMADRTDSVPVLSSCAAAVSEQAGHVCSAGGCRGHAAGASCCRRGGWSLRRYAAVNCRSVMHHWQVLLISSFSQPGTVPAAPSRVTPMIAHLPRQFGLITPL